MIERAGLSSEHRAALRYLTIANFWFDAVAALQALRSDNPVTYHLLHDFSKTSTQDRHLDGLTLALPEIACEPEFYDHHPLRGYRADVKIARLNIAQFQSMQSAKSVILERSSDITLPSRSAFDERWFGHWNWYCFTLEGEKRGQKEEVIHHLPIPKKERRGYYFSSSHTSLDWVWLNSLNLERLG